MKLRILGIGEALWDMLPLGRQIGGAPANFVCHAHALGAEAQLVSRVGDDVLGREIIACWKALGIPAGMIGIDAELPTGTVTVQLASDGQPRFEIHENVAWDQLGAGPEAIALASDADVVCFGTLAQRTSAGHAAICALLAATRPGALRVFDVNFRPPFVDLSILRDSLALADVLKLNEQELPDLARMSGIEGTAPATMAALARRFNLRAVALTRGSHGSLLYAAGEYSEHPGIRTEVVDTVGAGDSFTAALAIGLSRGWPLDRISRRANEVAAFVCSQSGATPPLPETLRRLFADPDS